MSSLPRILMPVQTENGKVDQGQSFDATLVIAEKLTQVFFFSVKHGANYIANLSIDRLLPLRRLPPAVRDKGWGVDREDLAQRIEAWVDAIGGRENLPSVVAHLRSIEASRAMIKEAEKALGSLKDAHVLPMVDAGVYYAPCQKNKLIRTKEEIPPPQLPFVFWTKEPLIWEGVSAAYIRRSHKRIVDMKRPVSEGTHLDFLLAELDAVIRADMEQHNEGAEEALEDLAALYAAVEAWEPVAGRNTPEDKGLEASVESWNKRQKIISYYPDFSRVSPLEDSDTMVQLVEKTTQFIQYLRDEVSEAVACYVPQNESRLVGFGA